MAVIPMIRCDEFVAGVAGLTGAPRQWGWLSCVADFGLRVLPRCGEWVAKMAAIPVKQLLLLRETQGQVVEYPPQDRLEPAPVLGEKPMPDKTKHKTDRRCDPPGIAGCDVGVEAVADLHLCQRLLKRGGIAIPL